MLTNCTIFDVFFVYSSCFFVVKLFFTARDAKENAKFAIHLFRLKAQFILAQWQRLGL